MGGGHQKTLKGTEKKSHMAGSPRTHGTACCQGPRLSSAVLTPAWAEEAINLEIPMAVNRTALSGLRNGKVSLWGHVGHTSVLQPTPQETTVQKDHRGAHAPAMSLKGLWAQL